MALVDRTGRLVRFSLSPGNAAEIKEVTPLLDGVRPRVLIADRAYDADWFRDLLSAHSIIATIPSKSNRLHPIPWDESLYKTRHLVENFFADLKQFRGVSTRYCKLAARFRAFVNLAAWCLMTR